MRKQEKNISQMDQKEKRSSKLKKAKGQNTSASEPLLTQEKVDAATLKARVAHQLKAIKEFRGAFTANTIDVNELVGTESR